MSYETDRPDRYFVPREQIIASGFVGGGAGAAGVVVLVGFFYLMLCLIVIWASAYVVAYLLMAVAAARRWTAPFEFEDLRWSLMHAFSLMLIVSFVLDLIFQTSYSPPFVLSQLDKPLCYPNCTIADRVGGHFPVAVETVSDYFGQSWAGLPGYILLQIPGALVFTWALGSSEPLAFQWPASRSRLWIASAASVTVAIGAVFPAIIASMIWLRNLDR